MGGIGFFELLILAMICVVPLGIIGVIVIVAVASARKNRAPTNLTICPACGHLAPPTATACPQCGGALAPR
jgi:hypothetical protein